METNIIPQPQRVDRLAGQIVLSAETHIAYEDVAARSAAEYLCTQRGAKLTSHHETAQIVFRRQAQSHGSEAYTLQFLPDGIVIEADAPAGWFYGVQTLLSLWPNDGECAALRAARIEDWPRFRWRGLMLDVTRHLMPVDGILRLIDNMATCKMNTLHWHLTDDQGWRVESKRFALLTQIGAYRRGEDGHLTPSRAKELLPHVGTYGGFYTQDEVRQVVAHAAARCITVVPEVEMPGHALAALAAYPQLACTDGPFETGVKMGIFEDVYCAGNDDTLLFLENVIEELLPLFPGEFFHVGGDECPKTRWKTCPKCQARIAAENLGDEHGLQSYVVRRMSRFLEQRGRRLIGWDEILEGGLAAGATVMSWRGTEGGIAGAKAGHDVVMTPHTHCYLDYVQAREGEPTSIPDGFLPLEKVYGYEPVPTELTPAQQRHILGVQGNLWTEYVHDIAHAEYMLWPRAAALAETGWSDPDAKDFADFLRRVPALERRLAESGSNYRPTGPAQDSVVEIKSDTAAQVEV